MTAYATRAPAGFAGAVTRPDATMVVPVLLNEEIAFGAPVKMVTSKASNVDASDAASVFYGVMQRSVPSISSITANDTASVDYAQGVVRKGFVNVVCATGTPAIGGQVYMRVVTESSQVVGDFETAYDYGLTAGAMVGTGNATAGTLSATSAAVAGVYSAKFTAATAFNLISPDGDIGKVGATGAAYTAFGLTFTITAGGTPAVAGDTIALTLVANNVALEGVSFSVSGKDSSNVTEIFLG